MTTQDSDSAQDPRPEWQFEFYHSNSVIELDAALTRLKRLLDTHLVGRYALDVVDVTDHPDRAEREKITATPTFLLRGPRETRKLLGVPSTVEDIHFLAGHTATQKQTPMNRNGRPTGPPSPSAAGSTAANDQELQLARAKAQLSQARQEIDEQEATIERLQSVNAELKDFAYRFAHDAKGPLRTVRQMIAFVEEDSGDALTEESRGDLQRAVDIAARLSTLMDNTLTYARAGAAPLTMKSVDLGKLLNWVSTDLRAALIESGGSVDIGPMPKVAGEESELYRLFLNLLGNAIKYRRPDVAPFVKIWSEPVKNSKQVRVHISDNGIGFDDSYGRRIFEPFTRLVDNSKYEGSGLGLAIVNRTVERHGGSISAKAKLGEGSTFSITLPAAPPTSVIDSVRLPALSGRFQQTTPCSQTLPVLTRLQGFRPGAASHGGLPMAENPGLALDQRITRCPRPIRQLRTTSSCSSMVPEEAAAAPLAAPRRAAPAALASRSSPGSGFTAAPITPKSAAPARAPPSVLPAP